MHLYNRQLHGEDKAQAKRLASLAKEQGLSYTEADVANQQALMDMSIDGKRYYGEKRGCGSAAIIERCCCVRISE